MRGWGRARKNACVRNSRPKKTTSKLPYAAVEMAVQRVERHEHQRLALAELGEIGHVVSGAVVPALLAVGRSNLDMLLVCLNGVNGAQHRIAKIAPISIRYARAKGRDESHGACRLVVVCVCVVVVVVVCVGWHRAGDPCETIFGKKMSKLPYGAVQRRLLRCHLGLDKLGHRVLHRRGPRAVQLRLDLDLVSENERAILGSAHKICARETYFKCQFFRRRPPACARVRPACARVRGALRGELDGMQAQFTVGGQGIEASLRATGDAFGKSLARCTRGGGRGWWQWSSR